MKSLSKSGFAFMRCFSIKRWRGSNKELVMSPHYSVRDAKRTKVLETNQIITIEDVIMLQHDMS